MKIGDEVQFRPAGATYRSIGLVVSFDDSIVCVDERGVEFDDGRLTAAGGFYWWPRDRVTLASEPEAPPEPAAPKSRYAKEEQRIREAFSQAGLPEPSKAMIKTISEFGGDPEPEKPRPLTPGEFLSAMRRVELKLAGDTECQHIAADETMCELLETLGYGEGVAVFRGMQRWYA